MSVFDYKSWYYSIMAFTMATSLTEVISGAMSGGVWLPKYKREGKVQTSFHHCNWQAQIQTHPELRLLQSSLSNMKIIGMTGFVLAAASLALVTAIPRPGGSTLHTTHLQHCTGVFYTHLFSACSKSSGSK